MSDFEIPMRCRRLRRTPAIRKLVQETRLQVSDLIAPVFVKDGNKAPEPVGTMPGVMRFSITGLIDECRELRDLGIPAIALFPCIDPALKNESGSHGFDAENIFYRAIRELKSKLPDLTIISDIALDPYTTHGHDGLLNEQGTWVENDATLEVLSQIAILQAEAGSDIVAPSDMMDGRVGSIRHALDDAGFSEIAILAYAAKFASSLYGPFRDAVGSAGAAGTHHLDKKGYQLNPANRQEALKDALLDEEEGADMLMVKPAGWYLDIIRELRNETRLPVAAYQISGEYAMIHSAASQGWLDIEKARDESLLAIKRAGADMILTYFAKEVAKGM